jgi:hypothetical protein
LEAAPKGEAEKAIGVPSGKSKGNYVRVAYGLPLGERHSKGLL